MRPILTISIFVLLLFPLSAYAQVRAVKQIKITSAWGGLTMNSTSPSYGEVLIEKTATGYYSDGKKIDDSLIRALLFAIHEPVIRHPRLANLGITQERLNANAESGAKEYAEEWFTTRFAPNQKALYFSTFKNLRLVRQILPSIMRGGWSDDFPSFEVEITNTNGTVIKVSSEAQPLFMLPWKLNAGRRTVKTYNAHISLALAKLIPPDFPNRGRISGNGFNGELSKAVFDWLEDDLNLLDAENKAGKYLMLLRSRFTVKTVEINSYHNVDYVKEWVNGNPEETNLYATLRTRTFPKNFFIGLVLPFENDRVEGMDVFFNNIERYRHLAMSVPWLNSYLAAHPKVNVELRFVKDRSFSERAMKHFTDDMKQLGKDSLAKEVAPVQKDVSLLLIGMTYGQGYWLVLPDKRVVLWRTHGGYDSLLKWKPENFNRKDCGEYQGECVGAVISQGGALLLK
jgi:hypothetical protein